MQDDSKKPKPKITVKGVENKKLTVELTEGQKNLAIDNTLLHTPDGINWLFFDDYLPLIQSLIKAHPNL
jgi:hypothetical protein